MRDISLGNDRGRKTKVDTSSEMGLFGLRRFIDASGCTHVIRQPWHESGEEEDSVYATSSSAHPSTSSSLYEKAGRGSIKQRIEEGNEENDDDEALQRVSPFLRLHSFPKKAAGFGKESLYTSFREHTDASASSSSFALSKTSHFTAAPHADHILIDLNCIIHSCLHACSAASRERDGQSVLEGCGKEAVIVAVLQRLEELLTTIIIPDKSLTICLDGPPPLAKLQTQRLRRRKVAYMSGATVGCSSFSSLTGSSGNASGHGMEAGGYRGGGDGINALSITAGSLFLVELENRIAAAFKQREGYGFLQRRCPVFLHGSTVEGEGENKIARALAYLAYGKDMNSSTSTTALTGTTAGRRGPYAGQRSSSQRDVFLNNGPPAYHPNDTVIVMGHDIDLVLTCVGVTYYHNISVLSPTSLQCIHVGEMLYRWWMTTNRLVNSTDSPLRKEKDFCAEALAPLRIDFIFLFLLNGGDHYEGAGDVAAALWRRYLSVRATSVSLSRNRKKKLKPDALPKKDKKESSMSSSSASEEFFFSLVQSNLMTVNVNVLADVLQAETYSGDADPEVGVQLLESALWSLRTIVTGVCPDYRYIPPIGIEGSGNGVPSLSPHPTLSHLRAAALYCKKTQRTIQFPPAHQRKKSKKGSIQGDRERKTNALERRYDTTPDWDPHRRPSSTAPLTPLEHYVALMPALSAMPKSIAQTLQGEVSSSFTSSQLSKILDTLLSSNHPLEIAAAAEDAIEASSAVLRPCERHLRQLTSPVQLNVVPPRVHLSRHAQHRLMALANKQAAKTGVPFSAVSSRKHFEQMLRCASEEGNDDPRRRQLQASAAVLLEDPEPVVRLISMPPPEVPVVCLEYPSYIKGLRFTFPFASGKTKEEEEKSKSTHSMMEGEKSTRKRKRSASKGGRDPEEAEEEEGIEDATGHRYPTTGGIFSSSAEGKILYLSSFYQQTKSKRDRLQGKVRKKRNTHPDGEEKEDGASYGDLESHRTWDPLAHKLAVAHRLQEKGAHQAAKGTKMRRKLRRVEVELSEAVRKAAAEEDWKYTVESDEDAPEGKHETKKKKKKAKDLKKKKKVKV